MPPSSAEMVLQKFRAIDNQSDCRTQRASANQMLISGFSNDIKVKSLRQRQKSRPQNKKGANELLLFFTFTLPLPDSVPFSGKPLPDLHHAHKHRHNNGFYHSPHPAMR